MALKKVLISVLSCQSAPYGDMVGVSERTWDSIDVEGAETVYFFGNPKLENTKNKVYFNIDESLFSMGYKGLSYFEYALTKEWDYMARVNSSCFVDKKELIKYVQTLPEKEVFEGLNLMKDGVILFTWGGGQYIISRDVIQLIVDHKKEWEHNEMEDVAMSRLVMRNGITPQQGNACSIDNMAAGQHTLMVYGHGEGCNFSNWSEFKKPEGQYFYRIKQDGHRHLEADIMEQLKRICYGI